MREWKDKKADYEDKTSKLKEQLDLINSLKAQEEAKSPIKS